MSELHDPRVLFAAERTLLAWSRIGLGFVLLGVVLSALSVVQYRRSVAGLRPVEVPQGYWINLSVFMSLAVGALGAALAVYLALS